MTTFFQVTARAASATAALLLLAAAATAATPDLPSCDVYRLACHYTSSNREASYDINRVVIHKTEGATAAGAASWFANCNSPGSAHYSFDKSNGYCYQSVLEKDIAWHAGYWNTQVCSIGIEHSGWVTSNDTSTACYNESALETRSCITYYGVPCSRSYIIGHSEVPGCATPGGGGKNCHTDPGRYWNWGYYMSQCQPYRNPNYYFGDGSADGFSAGHGSGAIAWTNCCGWPGVAFADQTGTDMYWNGPATNYSAQGEPSFNVMVYPEGGNTANHELQMFWQADGVLDANRSTPIVNYQRQNSWAVINLSANTPYYWGKTIQRLRLDFDNSNTGSRFIVNHVLAQSTPRFWFTSGTEGFGSQHSLGSPWWTNCCGWPGVMVVDQTGNDAYILTPPINSYYSASNDRIVVRVFPQYGGQYGDATTDHDMQIFWTTSSDPNWSESKSTGRVFYSGNDQYIQLVFDVGAIPTWPSNFITRMRLDLDSTNHGRRWLIDHMVIEHTSNAH